MSILKHIVNKIRQDEVVDLLSNLVKIPSENFRPDQTRGGEGEICEFLKETFTNIGFDIVETQETSFPGAFNVIGRIKGTGGGPSLLFNGHMDTVPANKMPYPFTPRMINGKLFGRGTCDMKGGLTSMIIACKCLIDSNINLHGDLLMTAVVDEEVTHEGITTLIKGGVNADYAVVGEPTNLEISYASKGKAEFQIETHGKTAHCSTPELGINAIVKMAKIISTLNSSLTKQLQKKRHPEFGAPVFTIVNIHGGGPVTLSTVPEHCKIEIDRRLIPGETYDEATKEIEDILEQLKTRDPQLQAELKLTDEVLRYPRLPFATPIDSKIVAALSEAYRDTVGKEPSLTVSSFYGDAEALRNKLGIPTVYFGSSGSPPSSHSDHENVPIDQIVVASKIFALTAMKICKASIK
jgi:acetylornithine deacetylase/succinyl-diaminopimelate desuccinylase family protein